MNLVELVFGPSPCVCRIIAPRSAVSFSLHVAHLTSSTSSGGPFGAITPSILTEKKSPK